MPTPSSSAALRVARRRAGLHVSTWKGKSIPWMRPPWAPACVRTKATARSSARRPASSSQLVAERALLVEPVIVGLVGGAQVGADAQLGGDGGVLLGRHADVDHRRAAVPEHLHQREAPADPPVLARRQVLHAGGRRVVVEEAGVEEVAAAAVGHEPAPRLHVRVAVDVDQAGDHQLPGGVDTLVDWARPGAADEGDAVVLEDQRAAAENREPP